MRSLLLFLALLAAPALAEETPFEPSGRVFADAAACKAHLATLVADAKRGNPAAVEGPYEIASGDVRAHMVLVSGSGHRITEHRCLADKLSARSWRHSIDGSEEEAPETIESMAAKAEWLKKSGREK